jgi:hypothetical protein
MKPENVLMAVDESHVRRLAHEATQCQRLGIKPSGSAIATAPQFHQKIVQDTDVKMSKNKKKKLRKKQKRISNLFDQQQKQIEIAERENLKLLCILNNEEDENKRASRLLEFSEFNISMLSPERKKLTDTQSGLEQTDVLAESKIIQTNQEQALNKSQKKKLKQKARKLRLKQMKEENKASIDITDNYSQNDADIAIKKNEKKNESNKLKVEEVLNEQIKNFNPVFEISKDENDLQVKIADLGNLTLSIKLFLS